MCGRFNLRSNLGQLVDQFLAEPHPQFQLAIRYNVAPTQQIPAVRVHDGRRQLVNLRWGLIPSWAKDTKVGFSGINARAETLAEKPAFRTAFKRRRCLVPASGYYEWLKQEKCKLPYLYEVDGGGVFAFAGLWEQWWGPHHKAETPLESCTIVTTEPNELARQVHDRMPAIPDPADYEVWLDPANQDTAELSKLLDPFPADRMTARPVSTFVNNARNEGSDCMKSAQEPRSLWTVISSISWPSSDRSGSASQSSQ